jgi:hypothetical protein
MPVANQRPYAEGPLTSRSLTDLAFSCRVKSSSRTHPVGLEQVRVELEVKSNDAGRYLKQADFELKGPLRATSVEPSSANFSKCERLYPELVDIWSFGQLDSGRMMSGPRKDHCRESARAGSSCSPSRF